MASKQEEYAIGSQILSEYLGSLFLVMAAIAPIILFNQVLGAEIQSDDPSWWYCHWVYSFHPRRDIWSHQRCPFQSRGKPCNATRG